MRWDLSAAPVIDQPTSEGLATLRPATEQVGVSPTALRPRHSTIRGLEPQVWQIRRGLARALRHEDPAEVQGFSDEFNRCLREKAVGPELLSSFLMRVFAETRNVEIFQLLYESSYRQIMAVIDRLRRSAGAAGVDTDDVLQETFIAIFRYPSRYRFEKSTSFRNWSYSIVRNAFLRQRQITPSAVVDVDSLSDCLEDRQATGPDVLAETAELMERLHGSYALCLLAYRQAYERLADRERRVLYELEIRGKMYKQAATSAGVHLPNLKMIVCRARKKLMKAMRRAITTGR